MSEELGKAENSLALKYLCNHASFAFRYEASNLFSQCVLKLGGRRLTKERRFEPHGTNFG